MSTMIIGQLARAEQIRAWRATGTDIPAIAALLRDEPRHGPIEQRLQQIAAEMARLREQQAPAAHAAFLQSLGIGADEIERIRSCSRQMGV